MFEYAYTAICMICLQCNYWAHWVTTRTHILERLRNIRISPTEIWFMFCASIPLSNTLIACLTNSCLTYVKMLFVDTLKCLNYLSE